MVLAPEAMRAASARILVVEDFIAHREMTARLLTEAGYQVDRAPDGLTAVSLVKSVVYDVVFMDLQMPHVDGIEATRMIRASPGPSCALPIFALTASLPAHLDQTVRSAGMNGLLQKPLGDGELLTLVDLTLHGSFPQPFRVMSRSFVERQPNIREGLRASIGDPAFLELAERFVAMLRHALDAIAAPRPAEDFVQRLRELENAGRTFGFKNLSHLSGIAADRGRWDRDSADLSSEFSETCRQALMALASEKHAATSGVA